MKKYKRLIPLIFIILFLLPIIEIFAHGISETDKQAMIEGGYINYIGLGATHMLTGYDHLLFLFGVIFFLTTFKQIVRFITAFTIGHSITLIIATFLKISANYFLIDAVIALSVCYKGFDNLDGFRKFLKINSPNLIRMVFVFGLIHGFGLSTRLQQLPLGEDSMGILMRIISFNVGVEFGQIAALTVMLILIATWRKRPSFKQFSIITNNGLIISGFFLVLFQLHGFLHSKFPDEMGFSEDLHKHSHIESELEAEKPLKHDSFK